MTSLVDRLVGGGFSVGWVILVPTASKCGPLAFLKYCTHSRSQSALGTGMWAINDS